MKKLILLAIISALGGGCASLGRVAQSAAGLIAPEYKATADNLYSLLAQDQILASIGMEAVLITSEGRVLRKDDVTPSIIPRQQSYSWDALPAGFFSLFSGDNPRATPELEAQRQALSDALKAVPTTEKTK